jgi:transposase
MHPQILETIKIYQGRLLYRWKAKLLSASGPAATTLEHRVRELEEELRRVERERDILKKALAIFSQ